MQAMLLAAGLGSRLRPLTDLRPKPIVPVANLPLAAFAMEHLARVGVRSIVANTHPRPHEVESALRAACPSGVALRFSRERVLLGTGGGLNQARALFDEPHDSVIVMNGDTLFAPDLGRALQAHQRAGAVATMILRAVPDPARYGAIGIDEHGWVRTLLGAPRDRAVARQLMFTGVHILAPEAFSDLPREGCVIRTAYRGWVDRGAPVLGVLDDAPWADLGTIAEYHRLNLELASGSFPWPGIAAHHGSISASRVDPPDRVRSCVIGRDVSLDEGVVLERCVVWSETRVRESATDAVLTPAHRIQIN